MQTKTPTQPDPLDSSDDELPALLSPVPREDSPFPSPVYEADRSFAAYLHRDAVLSDQFACWPGHVALRNLPLSRRAALFAETHAHLFMGRVIDWVVEDYLSRQKNCGGSQ